jgi:hypothetical protein
MAIKKTTVKKVLPKAQAGAQTGIGKGPGNRHLKIAGAAAAIGTGVGLAVNKLKARKAAKLDQKVKADIEAEKTGSVAKQKKGGSTGDKKWIQKAINPAHKGYCTPMTKPTCTPKRKALAKTLKKMAKNR